MSKRYEGELKPFTGTIVCDIDLNKDGKVIPAYTPFELKDGEILFTNEVYNVKKRIWEADYE